MQYQVTTEHVWYGAIPERPGALAERLRALARVGVNLELIVTRRDMPGRALLYISPLRTIDEVRAAEEAGMTADHSMQTVRVEGPNVPGLGARIAGALGDAGISIAAYTAAALGGLHVTNLAFDDEADADEARRVLARVLG